LNNEKMITNIKWCLTMFSKKWWSRNHI
jgi:hypothetical protein